MNYKLGRIWTELLQLIMMTGETKSPPSRGTSINMGCVLAVIHVLLLHQPASFCVSWCVTAGE